MTLPNAEERELEQVGLGKIGGDRNATATHPVPSPPIDPTSAKEREPMTATQERKAGPRGRPLDIVREGDGDPRHGKLSTYNNHHCRCAACTMAMREYSRFLRERRRRALDV